MSVLSAKVAMASETIQFSKLVLSGKITQDWSARLYQNYKSTKNIFAFSPCANFNVHLMKYGSVKKNVLLARSSVDSADYDLSADASSAAGDFCGWMTDEAHLFHRRSWSTRLQAGADCR